MTRPRANAGDRSLVRVPLVLGLYLRLALGVNVGMGQRI